MAISRGKKDTLVADMENLLAEARVAVYALYQGLSVADVQELRKLARESDVKIRVIKNRLVKVAMAKVPALKDVDTSGLNGQLLYAVGSDDVAPAQVLDKFAKDHAALVIKGAFTLDGANLTDAEVKALAKLPSKNQLIAEVVAMLMSPVNDTVSALGGNMHGLLDAIATKNG